MAQNSVPNSVAGNIHPVLAAAIEPHLHPVKPSAPPMPLSRPRAIKHRVRQVTSTQDVQHAAHRAIDDLMAHVSSPWSKIGTITLHVTPETYNPDTDQVTRPLMVEATTTVTMRIRGTGQPDRG